MPQRTLCVEAFQQLITQSFLFQSKQSLANLQKIKKQTAASK
jgi:hypothetical protein